MRTPIQLQPAPDQLERIIIGLVGYGRMRILGTMPPDSCIASTRIAKEVLAHFGYVSSPKPCTLIAVNQTMCQHYEGADVMNHKPDPKQGEIALGLGFKPPQTEAKAREFWNGHLVLIIPATGEHLMLDMTLDQLSRPEFDMPLGPICLGLSPTFHKDGGLVEGVSFEKRGKLLNTLLRYQWTTDEDYLNTETWRLEDSVSDILIQHIIAYIENGKEE